MEEKTVSLSLKTILRECSLNPNLFLDEFYHIGLKNRENIHSVFKYRKFNDDFVERVDCFNDGSNPIGMIRPSYDEFLTRLVILLNLPIKGKIVDDEHLTELLLQRVEVLKHISSYRELQLEFPLLYKDLKDGRRYYDDLQRLKTQEGKKTDQFVSGEHYYYGCGMKKSLPNFVETQSEVYRRFVVQRHELQQLQQQTAFNGFLSPRIDKDKLFLYVMHEYLVKAEGSQDKKEIEKYISLTEKCLASCKKRDFFITTDSGVKITFTDIMNRLEHLKLFVHDNCSLVEWILIPEGKDYSKVQSSPKHESRVTLMNYEEIQRLQEKGSRKKAFYESTPYLLKVIGLRKYRGYVGWIYENGEVFLDRKYDPEKPSTAEGDAIINLNVENFEVMSQWDKQRLRKDPRVGIMYHSSTWESRVSKKINRPATPEESIASHQLVKRLSNKNESK